MWYRFKKANIGGGAIKSTPLLPVSSEGIENKDHIKDSPDFKNYDELNEDLLAILTDMGQTLEDYYNLSKDQQKELWEIMINRPHQVVDQEASRLNRLKSPYHENIVPLELALEPSRESSIALEPINMQSQEAGNGVLLQTGLSNSSFFQQGQSGAAFKGDLPSARTLI
jgi:hypothetical protein